MLDLLLVNPNSKPTYGELNRISAIEPPLWCALLASYARECGYTVRILDADVENLSFEETAKRIAQENPLLVALIAMGQNPSVSSTPKMTVVGQILEKLKEQAPHIKTLVGGLHPSALPRRTLREEKPDFVMQGEGFRTISCLLSELKTDKSTANYCIAGLWHRRQRFMPSMATLLDLDSLPTPAWDLLPMARYRAHNWHCLDQLDQRSPYGVLVTSYGCPFYCSYCPIHAIYNNSPGIRFLSLDKVVEQVDFLVKNYNIKNFKIWDEMFVLNKDRVNQICDLLIERDYGLNVWAYARADTVNEAILEKMKLAGINWLAYGFESASELVRQGVDKRLSQEQIRRAVEITRNAGINIQANFICGLPDDTTETMHGTLEMAKEFNFEWLNLYVAMPYPGSQLYVEAVKQGAQLPKKWADWGQYSEGFSPLPTKYLSGKEIVQFRDKAFIEYFNRPEYLQMVEQKFGVNAQKHIKEMLKVKISRKENG